MRLSPRPPGTAVVTGASSGIGAACALRLDRSGCRVFAGVRREEDGDALRRRASALLTPVVLEVTDPASISSAARTVAAAVGATGLGGLVNNAGIVMAGPLEFLPIEEIRRQFEVNAIGQIAVTQAFLPLLRAGRGRIVNIGSTGGRIAMPFIGSYNASKFAMEAFTDALRMELRASHIPVSLVAPSFIVTPMWEKATASADDMLTRLPQAAQEVYGPVLTAVRAIYPAWGKSGTPAEDVARTVVRALTAARPKTRYFVGKGARFQAVVVPRLPDRMRDFLLTTMLLRWAKRDRG